MNKKSEKNQRIQVFARCRPLNSIEKKQCSPSVVEVIPEKKEIVIKDRNSNREFFFDKVFQPDTKQIAIYKAVVAPLIQEVLMGYNCTVFAYGQTGTGKTYTMEGERNNTKCSWEDDPAAGIIPRSLHQLFEELNKEENVEFSVRVSFLELYNEELFDLLSVTELSRLRLFEDSSRKGSVIIQGLEEIIVNTKDEVYAILEKGTSRRQTAATMLNATSSRSHTVFSVTVHIKENTVEGEELLKTGKLNLVDLAGSENVGRSGAIDKRAREAGNINQSLLTLGRVITALIEKQPHVPYRESKLTRLLQDSLGGHTKTSIIATISPALCNFDETISTLDYATKAKSITIKPEINQKMTKRALIREYTEEIERLRKDLSAVRSNEGFYIHQDNYMSMQKEIALKADDIKILTDKIELLTEENAKIEEMFNSTKDELGYTSGKLEKTTQLYEETSAELSQKVNALAYTQKVLSKTTLERDENQFLINIQKNTEKKLSSQAKMLLQVAEETTTDVDKLHAKLDRKAAVERTNEERSQEFRTMYQKQFAKLDDMVSSAKDQQVQKLLDIKECINNLFCGLCEYKEMASEGLNNNLTSHNSNVNSLMFKFDDMTSHQKQWTDNTVLEIHSNVEASSSRTHLYLSERLPVQSKEFTSKTEELERWLTVTQRSLCSKIDSFKSTLETQTKTEQDLLNSIKYSHNLYLRQQEDLVQKLNNQVTHLSRSLQKNEEEIQSHFNLLASFANRQKEDSKVVEEAVLLCNTFQTNISDRQDVENSLEQLLNGKELCSSHLLSLDDIAATLKLQEFSSRKDALHQSNDLHSKDVTDFIKDSEKLEKENFEKIKKNFEAHFDQVSTQCDTRKKELINITSSLTESLNSDKSSLEHHNATLQNLATSTSHEVVECEVHTRRTTEQVKREILQRDLEFEKFLSEDLLKDIPTGTTPYRKQVSYPRILAATSPHDRILQRYRTKLAADTEIAINLPLDNSFTESEESKHSTDGSSHNASTVSEEYDSTGCETDSNVSSMSDISVDGLKNKENNKLRKKASKLPKRVSKKDFLRPPPRSIRKPLSASNSDLQS